MTMLIDKENIMFTKDNIMLANIDVIFPTFFIFRSSSLGVDNASIYCSFFSVKFFLMNNKTTKE